MSRMKLQIETDEYEGIKLTANKEIKIDVFTDQNNNVAKQRIRIRADNEHDIAIVFINGVQVAKGYCPIKKGK